MMCQCRFLGCDKSTLVINDDNGRGYSGVGTAGMLEISVPSSQFFWDPKSAIKIVFF